MKILILTTITSHHNFFVHKIYEQFKNITLIVENESLKSKYSTFHEFEVLRDRYEKNLWNKLINIPLGDICKKLYISQNINDKKNIDILNTSEFDVCIVFGTSKIKDQLLNILPLNTYNLHGGDPQFYRGLDSHLWSIWYEDINGLKVCLHRVDKILDNGDIFQLEKINIHLIKNLYQLRSVNTEMCVKLSLNLLKSIKNKKNLKLVPQAKIGKYYSFMTSEKKNQCLAKFNNLKNI
tara:strand:+ start:493 stop:1203 length:711 start_codon:yes stop_codon:yes gene_type:complete